MRSGPGTAPWGNLSAVTPEEIFQRATNPRQYDSPDLDWSEEGVLSSPAMKFFHRYLRRELGRIAGKAVLDIGCGTGHLSVLLDALGARHVVGLEPSARNVSFARRHHPDLVVVNGGLMDSDLPPEFDLAVAVMSFEHQPELRAAFRRVSNLLRPGGAFYLVVGDKAYHLTPRFDLGLEAHERPDGSVLIATRYPFGTIHDVVRPVDHYERAARAEGFEMARRVSMVPTEELFESDPRWREFEGRPVAHLLVATRRPF